MNKEKPLVSVLMLTYGHEKYIRQAIEGVLLQEIDFPIEFLIVNDCSPDNSDEIIRETIQSSPDNITVKYVRHIQNMGIMPNFIWALNEVRGEYIALCEGDDYWTDPKKLQLQKEIMKDEEISLTFHAAKTINGEGKLGIYNENSFIGSHFVPKHEFLKSGGGGFATATLFFRKSILENLPNYFLNCGVGDYPLAFLAATYGKVFYLDRVMATYRISADNSWSSKLDEEKILQTIEGEFLFIKQFHDETDNQFLNFTKRLEKRLYMRKTLQLFRLGYKKESLVFFFKSARKMGVTNIARVIKNCISTQ